MKKALNWRDEAAQAPRRTTGLRTHHSMLESQPLAQILSVEQLDEMLLAERECGVVLRFGRGSDPRCAAMDAAIVEAAQALIPPHALPSLVPSNAEHAHLPRPCRCS